MEYSLEQDSMTIDSQVSLVSKVWFLCETVRAPVQLLLPDQKEIPFYLNKNTKFSTKKWELSNVDSLNNITESSKSKRSPRRRKIKLASLLPAVRRTIGKEHRIEEALLKPYRDNEEAKQELILKYAIKPKVIKSPRFELQPPLHLKSKLSPRVKNQLEAISTQHSMLSVVRGTQGSVALKEHSITENNSNDVGNSHAVEVKKMLWFTIASTLIAFQNITLNVQKMRIIRNLDVRKWNAALVIQRNWRYHFYITNQNHPQSSPRNKRNKSWHGCYSYKNSHSHYDSPRDNSKGRAICKNRGRSCALITRFLVDLRHGPLNIKFCFRGYIKKIKTIQRVFHSHLQANAARVTLLSRHIDRISEFINIHISTVLSERGLDIDLMYPFDLNRLSNAGKNINPSYILPRILSRMESASFHAFLRKIPLKALTQLQKCFVPLFGSRDIRTNSGTASNSAPPVGGKYSFPHLVKGYRKALYYDMLFRARRHHLQGLRSRAKQALALKVPVFDTEDAREFISGLRETFDPLSNFLVEALHKNDEIYQTIQTSSKKGEFGGVLGVSQSLRRLKLIEQVSAEDIVLLLLQLSEQPTKQEQLHRAEEMVKSDNIDGRPDYTPASPGFESSVVPALSWKEVVPRAPIGSPNPPMADRSTSPFQRRKNTLAGDSAKILEDSGMKARPPQVVSPRVPSQTFTGRSGRLKA